MKKRLLLLLPALLLALNCRAQGDSLHARMLGRLDYTYQLNDVWGYVDTAGNEYALVGTSEGVSIVSLANPAAPTELFWLPGASSTWRDFATWGHYAYVTTEASAGLRIIDLGGLPGSIQYYDTLMGGYTTAHTIATDERGYAYVNGLDSLNGGILVLDLNPDPWRPQAVGSYSGNYVHDCFVRDDTIYSAETNAGQFAIIDASNPAQPVRVASGATGSVFTHTTWLDDGGDVLFTADEMHGAYFEAWDIQDIQNPVFLDRIRSSRSGATASPHNQYYLDGFLVCSYYEDGLVIVDASHPRSMVEVGYYDTFAGASIGLSGAWAAYPYLPSGIVLVSDMVTGLWVIEADYRPAAFVEGTVRDDGTGMPIGQATIELLSTAETATSAPDGYYSTGLADAATVVAEARAFGYQVADTTISMVPGQTITWNPRLLPLPTTPVTIHVADGLNAQPVAFAQVELRSGPFRQVAQADANGDLALPAIAIETYEVRSWRWGHQMGMITATVDSSQNAFTVTMMPGYADDFSMDLGWTSTGVSGEGQWERAEPQATFNSYNGGLLAPGVDYSGDYMDKAFVTGNGSALMDGDDVDSRTVLTSPIMDLAGWTAPKLFFRCWFSTVNPNNGASGIADSIIFYLDNGSQSQRIWFRRDVNAPLWRADSIDLTGIVPLTSTMRLRVVANDGPIATLVEAGLDDVLLVDMALVAGEAPSAEPDLTAAPNPSPGQVRVHWRVPEAAGGWLEVLDLQGRSLLRQALTEAEGDMVLGDEWPRGIYLVRLQGGTFGSKTLKIVRL